MSKLANYLEKSSSPVSWLSAQWKCQAWLGRFSQILVWRLCAKKAKPKQMNSKILDILCIVCLPIGKIFPIDLAKNIRASPLNLEFSLNLWFSIKLNFKKIKFS